MNLESLIGVPYQENGRSPQEGFDCYGLVLYVLKEELRIAPEKSLDHWREYGDVIEWPTELRRYDVVLIRDYSEGVNHAGIAVNEFEFMHATPFCGGVVCEPISRYAHKKIFIGRVRDPRN